MSKKVLFHFFSALFFLFCFCVACNNKKRPPASEIAVSQEDLDKKVSELIHTSLDYAAANNSSIDDTLKLGYLEAVQLIYEKKWYASLWTEKEQWKPLGDSLLYFIDHAKLYGLFPEDYHLASLDTIRKKFKADSFGEKEKRDAVNWAKADLLLTDAFVHIIRDIKLGRLPQDSITLRADSVLDNDFYYNTLALIQKRNSLGQIFHTLEPKHPGYVALRDALPGFLDSADDRTLTVVPSPKSNNPDFKKLLQTRLYEGGFLAADTIPVDSLQLSAAIKSFQERRNITADGKAGEETIRVLNTTDRDRFVKIAISLDRYKLLPEKMPDRYVWVNLPSFYLRFWENDSLKLLSKIICGKPTTRTPLLTSAISQLVTFPQWTIPSSIIEKEILPGIKRDSDYLAKKGFSLIDDKGDEVDPHTVEWSKYRKGIPYKVVQGSGDDNALGILKFNFPNKYAVYLHDTNQRYLFARTGRSLSHGCVRVQDWQKLAYSIVRYDYKDLVRQPSPVEDSLTSWLARKEKHNIAVRNRLPVYIRYFTCEADQGRVLFYDDIYGEDKALREKYFSGK